MAVTLKGQTAVYEGTSTDTKPTDADNNAIFKELDTGIRYYYDGTDWNEIPRSGGGGGGGTGTDNYNDLNNKPSINGTTLSGNKSLDNLDIQAKLTFDSTPTEDSENPVESGGVYSALAGKQDTISDLSTIRRGAAAGATAVQPATLDTALAGKQDALSSEQRSAVNSGITSADVEQITTNKNNISTITPALKECVDNGAKNRLPTTSTTTYTNNGLTLVVNSDYSITITGTMTTVENTDMYFIGSWVNTSPFANYTGKNMQIYCKSPTSIDGQFKMYDRTAKKTYAVAINNNEGTNISGDLTAAYFTIAATADAINVTLYPMICEPSSYIVSQQYIPPAMSNAELTAEVKPPAYSNPTPQSTDITLQSGGYYKIGNSVTVCIRATVSNALAAWAPIFSGLPVPITDSSIAENSAVVAVSSNAGVGIGITKQGIMQGFDAIPTGTLLLNCTYLCV